MIQIRNISKTFEGKPRIHAIDSLSLDVNNGEFVAFVGPSGCGKSTLLRIIGSLLEPTRGQVEIDEKTPEAKRLGRAFSFVFQKPALLPWRSVIGNVCLPAEISGHQLHSAKELLRKVGLNEFEHAYPNQLSGGMQQRVALARALSVSPEILCMDEPFAAVDDLTRADLNQLLMQLWLEFGMTVFFVTHNIDEAVFLSQRVVVLSQRPARVVSIHEVPFNQPRTVELKGLTEFQELVRCIRLALLNS